MIAVTCLNEAKDTSACHVDQEKAQAIVEEYQKRSTLTLKAAEAVDNAGGVLFRAVWENKKGEWAVVQYVPDKNVCTSRTPDEYREQIRKEQRGSRWL
jgi:predicted RNA-binding protein with PUA domain